MTWELYEVWSESDNGHQELIETTASLKKAREIAAATLKEESIVAVAIYQETEDGDFEVVSELAKSS